MSKKVLHILNSNKFSGAENVVVTIIEHFRKIEDETEFVYVSRDGSIGDVLAKKGIVFEPIQSMNKAELRRVIKKHRPDIIHAHDFTASIISAATAGKIPVISHIHNNSPWIKKYGLKSFAYGLSCLKYKHILGVSSSVFDEYVFEKYISSKSMVVGNPIDNSRIVRLAEEANATKIFDLCFLGRLTEQKDPHRFVELVNGICKIMPIKAVMMGDGEYRQEIENKISEYELSDNIDVLGFVGNPYGILKNSKVLCAPSKWEGFGLMATEALCLGVPIAASPVGGLVDIITDKCGKLCSTDKDFIDFIAKMLRDDECHKKFSYEALMRAKELDNIDEYCNKLKKIYELVG